MFCFLFCFSQAFSVISDFENSLTGKVAYFHVPQCVLIEEQFVKKNTWRWRVAVAVWKIIFECLQFLTCNSWTWNTESQSVTFYTGFSCFLTCVWEKLWAIGYVGVKCVCACVGVCVCVCVYVCVCVLFIGIVQRNWACLTWKSAIEIKSLLLLLLYRICSC